MLWFFNCLALLNTSEIQNSMITGTANSDEETDVLTILSYTVSEDISVSYGITEDVNRNKASKLLHQEASEKLSVLTLAGGMTVSAGKLLHEFTGNGNSANATDADRTEKGYFISLAFAF